MICIIGKASTDTVDNAPRYTPNQFAKKAVFTWGNSARHLWSEDYYYDESKFMTEREVEQVQAAIDHQVERTKKILGETNE